MFGVSAGVILLYDLVRVLTGEASEDDLVAVRESEELSASRDDDRGLHALAARRHGARHADRVRADRLRRRADGSLDIFDSQIVAQNIINGADSFPLMAVPFFMLAGEIMNTGGLARRIVNVALALVGHVRGGLGYVAILASCILSSLSGSAVADAAALAALLVPMMVAAGHNKA